MPGPREPLLPQHLAEPSALIAHACVPPASTEVKVPSGGEDWPQESSPQQAIDPSVRTPQVWYPAALPRADLRHACALRTDGSYVCWGQ